MNLQQAMIEAGASPHVAELLVTEINQFVASEKVTIRAAILKFEMTCVTTDDRSFGIGHHVNIIEVPT